MLSNLTNKDSWLWLWDGVLTNTRSWLWLWSEMWPVLIATAAWYVGAFILQWLPNTSDTEFAGVIAAAAAVVSSALTGGVVHFSERAKHIREVKALKEGLVIEMTRMLETMLLNPVRNRDTNGYDIVHWILHRSAVNMGFPVYERSADRIAMAGSKFSQAAVRFYSWHLEQAAKTNNANAQLRPIDLVGVINLAMVAIELIGEKSETQRRAMLVVRSLAASLTSALCDVETLKLTEEDARRINKFLSTDAAALHAFDESTPPFALFEAANIEEEAGPLWKAQLV